MNSAFPNRWSFSYLKFTNYVTNIKVEFGKLDKLKVELGQLDELKDELGKFDELKDELDVLLSWMIS